MSLDPPTKKEFCKPIKPSIVRQGSGITGVGVSNIQPHLAGRLNMAMLKKMEKDRGDQTFASTDDADCEFDNVKHLLNKKAELKAQKEYLLSNPEKFQNPIDYKRALKRNEREKNEEKDFLLDGLKDSFKHITGMWRKTAK